MLGDLGHDVESLVFSIADLDYNRWTATNSAT